MVKLNGSFEKIDLKFSKQEHKTKQKIELFLFAKQTKII